MPIPTVSNFETMNELARLLKDKGVLLADGATGTAYFSMGLSAGDPPELWNVTAPEKVGELHREFVDAGSDIILTNSFGANRDRLKLHGAESRVYELNCRGAEVARCVAEDAGRQIVVAGSIGPLGELFEPLGALTHDSAFDAFAEQARGLKDGGADVCWIETMSAPEEIRAAAMAAASVGMPYVATASFDTAGKTMMGLDPAAMAAIFSDLESAPVAYGANCGVGASDLLVAMLSMADGQSGVDPATVLVAKANCGIPQVRGDHVHYTGTPALMADYARLAIDCGIGIIGGCCGTSAEHVAAMRSAIDSHTPGARPDRNQIEAQLGRLIAPPAANDRGRARVNRRRRA